MILAVFSEQGRKALLAIDQGRVERYLDFDVVTGSTGRYVVDEDFCTCQDFVYRGRRCWHILAVRIADLAGLSQETGLWYLETIGE
jgi:predicted nucleic acid-binding Zn finger protein